MSYSGDKPVVPEGITFGKKVLVAPSIASGFTHSGDITEFKDGRNYHWVQRGEPVAEFYIQGSLADSAILRAFTSKRHAATIRAPASGLLLYSRVGIGYGSGLGDMTKSEFPPLANFSLLLPDDEPAAEDGSYMFGDVCRLIRDFQHYYFKNSRFWSMGPFTRQDLESLLEQQQTSACGVFDAMPRWSDYFDEARSRHPHLRPYLKHLR